MRVGEGKDLIDLLSMGKEGRAMTEGRAVGDLDS